MYEDSVQPIDVDRLHERLYAGAIVRFPTLPAMQELVDLTQSFVERALSPHRPTEIHRCYEQTELAPLLAAVQRDYSNLPEAKAAWKALFVEAGLDPEDAARDRLILRFQPPHPPGAKREWARSTATVGFHRDSWGSNLYAQVNWWAPVYEIAADRTFAFYPELFGRALKNSSDGFDIADVMRRNRGGATGADAVKQGEMTPKLLEELDPAGARPVTIQPGEIIAFSAQHAHVGVQNVSDLTRISLDTRTLRLSDHRAGRSAKNVDGRAKWVTYGLFRRLSDGKPLAEVLGVEPMTPFTGPWPEDQSAIA